jgi:hypothetical protein
VAVAEVLEKGECIDLAQPEMLHASLTLVVVMMTVNII